MQELLTLLEHLMEQADQLKGVYKKSFRSYFPNRLIETIHFTDLINVY